MPIRKHKRFSRPRKMYDLALIKEERGLIKKYGLKSRREVWKAADAIKKIRNNAKKRITADEKIKEQFVERQRKKGFEVNNIADVLALNKEDYLKRRLESIVVKKKFAKTHKQARQFIAHRHVKIAGSVINIPGHLTNLEDENSLSVDLAVPVKESITNEEKQFLESIKSGSEEKQEVEA